MLTPQSGKDALRLAIGFAASGAWSEARSLGMELLELRTFKAEAQHLLGCVACGECDWSAGVSHLDSAVRLRPQNVVWLRDLGVALIAANRPAEAVPVLARCLALDRRDQWVQEIYALALLESGNLTAALTVFRRVLGRDPCSSEALIGSARCLFGLGRLQEAATLARRGLQLNNDSPEGHAVLERICNNLQEYDAALSHCVELLRLRPDDSTVLGHYAYALYFIGETEKSMSLFREAMAKDDNSNLHSIFLTVLLHHSGSSSSTVTDAHRNWGRLYAPPDAKRRKFAMRISKRKLKVGYLIGEGRNSPTIYFLNPILQHHNRAKFDVVVYYTEASMRGWAAGTLSSKETSDAVDLSETELTTKIIRDGVDILVEISGHYATNLFVAASRPAPVQVAFPSYPASTGVCEMDYIFTDPWTCAMGQESQYIETPVMLQSGYLVYDPPLSPRIPPLPAVSAGFITFGVFQRPSKLSPPVWDLIAEVLRRVPDSMILFHNASADLDRVDSLSRQRLTELLESRAIPAVRCRFLGSVSLRRHLAAIASVDIALDSFPYTGQTTTCECLWMGVPVVTLTGTTHVSRVSAGIVSRVGLTEYVAATPKEYVDIAVKAAGDVPALAKLRKELRNRFRSSTVFDGALVVREMEHAYRQMWRERSMSCGRELRK
jgi:predicted O-linked N-acetylglucosamine transferase (SPINDLY family)